jgi:ABC-2 type transport system ATP-binding protein
MSTAICCSNLRKTYDGSISAVRGVDIRVEAGECYGLLGPNGAGKTTIVEILEGLLDPSSGQVELLGRTWDRDARELRALIGVSLQETRLSEKLTVRETVELFSSFYPFCSSPSDTLEQVDLSGLSPRRTAWGHFRLRSSTRVWRGACGQIKILSADGSFAPNRKTREKSWE